MQDAHRQVPAPPVAENERPALQTSILLHCRPDLVACVTSSTCPLASSMLEAATCEASIACTSRQPACALRAWPSMHLPRRVPLSSRQSEQPLRIRATPSLTPAPNLPQPGQRVCFKVGASSGMTIVLPLDAAMPSPQFRPCVALTPFKTQF